MGKFLDARRRVIARHGRPMTLRRVTAAGAAPIDLVVQGVLSAFMPEQLVGGIVQGDAHASILVDEITAAAWPTPPRARDTLIVERGWQVVGVTSVVEASSIIGYNLWLRGGA